MTASQARRLGGLDEIGRPRYSPRTQARPEMAYNEPVFDEPPEDVFLEPAVATCGLKNPRRTSKFVGSFRAKINFFCGTFLELFCHMGSLLAAVIIDCYCQ